MLDFRNSFPNLFSKHITFVIGKLHNNNNTRSRVYTYLQLIKKFHLS